MEYGFAEFFDREHDKLAESFFRRSNNNDALGLRRMNIRLSNILFPFGNTLMPNLEYFYYLNAIYHNVVEDEKNPTETEIKRINDIERDISAAIRGNKNATSKGFYGEKVKDSVRAYSRYKNSMKKMHYMEKNWKPEEEKGNLGRPNSGETLQDRLEETERYQAVKKICGKYQEIHDLEESDPEHYKKLIEEKIKGNHAEWVYKLEPREKQDFICRVMQRYPDDVMERSLFANIVEWCNFEKKEERLPEFGRIGEEYRLSGDVKDVYAAAERYSALQSIAKIAYNMCLYSEYSADYQKRKKREIECITAYQKKYKEHKELMRKDFYASKKIREKICGDRSGSGGDASDLDQAFDFINNIHRVIKDEDKTDEMIQRIREIVREREADVLGDEHKIGSGFGLKPIGEYIDTFRWEYRPEFARDEALQEDGEKDDEEDDEEETSDVKGSESRTPDKKPHNLCAQYYIWELFCE